MSYGNLDEVSISGIPFSEVIIDALCGVGFPSMEFAEQMRRDGYAVSTGNQWNADWKWDRTVLAKMSTWALMAIYRRVKGMA